MTWLICLLVLSTGGYEIQSANRNGTYYNVAKAIAEVAEDVSPSDNFYVTESLGSSANLDSLYHGKVDFALVQSDDLHTASRDHTRYPFLKKRVRAIGAIHPEPIHIVFRKNLNLRGVGDLVGRSINLGPVGSGTYNNAMDIAVTADILDEIDTSMFGFNEAVDSLIAGTIDVAFFTQNPIVSNPLRDEVLDTGDFDVLSLHTDFLKKARREIPYLKQMYIHKQAYPELGKAILTLGVQAVLVCSSEVPEKLVRDLTTAIYEHPERFPEEVGEQLDVRKATADIPIALHPGAKEYYDGLVFYKRSFGVVQWGTYLLVIGILFYLVLRTYAPRARRHSHIKLLRLLYLLVIIWATGASVMYAVEGPVNENFGSISESAWSIATYLLSGFEDKYPATSVGRILALIILIGGIGLVAYITAEIASVLTHHRIRGENEMERFKDHLVLCNWTSRGERILAEVLSKNSPLRKIDIGVLGSKELEFVTLEQKIADRVEKVEGDPRSLDCLKRAKVERAKAIIVLADDSQGDPDGHSALAILAIREAIGVGDGESAPGASVGRGWFWSKGKGPCLLAEVSDPRNREVLKNAGADTLVCGEDFAIGILAQTAVFPGMTRIYKEFLEYERSSNEFYVVPLSELPAEYRNDYVLGKTFREVAYQLLEVREKDSPIVLVGVKKDRTVILNPRRGEQLEWRRFERFSEEDSLILLSYEKPDLNRLFQPDKIEKISKADYQLQEGVWHSKFGDLSESITTHQWGGQILICNWGPSGEKIVEELHDKSSPARHTNIVILTNEPVDDRPYIKRAAFKDKVVFLTGRTSNINVLKKLGAHTSRSVIVLSPSAAEDPDGASTLTLLALKMLFEQELKPEEDRPNVVVEAVNHRNREVMEGAGASEIVSKDDLTMGILAQSCCYPQISEVYHELLDYDADNNEIYLTMWTELTPSLQEELKGKNFIELKRYFLERRSVENPLLLIGIERDGHFIVNPRRGETLESEKFDALREGDSLMFLSYEHPDFNLEKLET